MMVSRGLMVGRAPPFQRDLEVETTLGRSAEGPRLAAGRRAGQGHVEPGRARVSAFLLPGTQRRRASRLVPAGPPGWAEGAQVSPLDEFLLLGRESGPSPGARFRRPLAAS